ncbi:MAG: LPXTG cell wall anchor domain-containing protein [Ruminococcus sp.]|nr:LPXTG cell wall anchor domain-containing protein [Ruminococcus sp.]
MKMKKMLAILAALSVLGTTGLTVGAEDTATTTEPATEAITTTETEAETTAAETTAETETESTVETAATEENQVVKMEDASDEITIDGVSFTVKVSVASDSSVVLSILKDGNVTNLNNICVESKVSGELQVGNYYSVDSNNRLTIYGVDGNHNYIWSNEYNVFVASSLHEEGENLEIIDVSTFQMNGKTVKITLWSYEKESFDELLRLSVYVDGKLTNLSEITVNSGLQGIQGDGPFTDDIIYRLSVHQYFSVSGNVLTIKPNSAYGKTASYTFDDASGQFVTAGGAQTTTTTTAAETTTTTTTTKKEDAQPVTGDFQLDGVTLTPKIETKGQMGDNDGGLFLNIYSADETLLLSIRVALFNGGNGRPEGYYEVSRYLVKTGSNTIVVNDYSHFNVKKYHSYVFENGKFVSTGTTTDDNQEKTFTVEIPTSYVKAFCYKRGQEITESNYKDSMVISCTTITGCTNGTVSIVPNGYFVGGFLVKDAKPGTITITGTTGTYSSSEDPNVNTSHGQCGAGIGDRLDSFTVTVTIDENGNIVTGGSDNGDSGKTDNGSASNAPATKGTSSTPKTGDTTTVPAVAVGLTLTAAGVVAFISKRKK